MSLVVPDLHGEILMLQYIVGLVDAGNPVLHLYANNHTPTDSSVIGDLTQCTSAGYAPITLVSSNWTTTQSTGVTTAIYSEKTFTFSTNAVAYGMYVTTTTGALLWLEKFGSVPYEIPTDGGSITVYPSIALN